MTSISFSDPSTAATQSPASSPTTTQTYAAGSQDSTETFASHFQKSTAKKDDPASNGATTSSFTLTGKKEDKDTQPTKSSKQGDASAAAAVFTTPFQQTADNRSWLLSLPKTGPGTTSKDAKTAKTGLNSSEPVTDLKDVLKSGAPDQAETHALQKAQIAFSVTIPQNASGQTATQPGAGLKTSGVTAKTEALGSKTNPSGSAGTEAPAITKPTPKDAKGSSDKNHSETADKDQTVPVSPKVKDADVAIHPQPSSVHTADGSPASTASTSTPQHVSAYTAQMKPAAAATPQQTSAATDDVKPAVISKPQSIDLKLGGNGTDQVDVRVSQRAGDVQVTVRTADGELAQSLRHHLPELSDRLAQDGMQSDFWQPGASQSASSHTDTDSQDFLNRNGSQSQGQQGQPGDRSNRDAEDGRQSAWLNEMNNVEGSN